MILYLDTSTPTARIWLDENYFEHETNRNLAKNLLSLITEDIRAKNASDFLHHITAIAIMRGPGSYTGLRIGITVANTLASYLQIPIIGETGPTWRQKAQTRLKNGENHHQVLPLYNQPPKTTTPKK